MYNWTILLGILIGIVTGLESGTSFLFIARVIGTCAACYVLFLCRVLGAGDIKLMGVCVGLLGITDGLIGIVCGLVTALIVESLRGEVWNCGYQAILEREVRLAPYLLAGYSAMYLWRYFF